MNDLGLTLVGLAVQVTAVALAGLLLSSALARREPAVGVPATSTTLGATLALTVLAACPLPSWWALDAAPSPDATAAASGGGTRSDSTTGTGQPDAATAAPPGGVTFAGLLASLPLAGHGSAPAPGASPWHWPAYLAVCAGTGSALGLIRLLLGLWAVRRSCRRSAPVEDAELLRLADELRLALGVRRPVAVRQSPDLTTAATVGWYAPVLLLPADWRDWTDGQRRAVVAHELAHVRQGDFAGWVLARLCVALHFWHPLVRALAGRLHLCQELAADATAARLVGGRPAYLRALAELALRNEGRAYTGTAPAFLSSPTTLLRRLAMLRVKEDAQPRPVTLTGRRLAFALLVALTVAVSALRGPTPGALADHPAPATSAASPKVAPFDLSLLGDAGESDGVFAVRVAELLKRDGAKATLRSLNYLPTEILEVTRRVDGVGLRGEDIEQLLGRVYCKGENAPGKRTLVFSLNALRTTRDFDWAKLVEPAMKRHRWKGETYVSFPLPPALQGITGTQGEAYFWAPDARTLVFDGEAAVKAGIEAKVSDRKPAPPAYATGWDKVSGGLFALALDNRGGRLSRQTLTDAERRQAHGGESEVTAQGVRFYDSFATLIVGCAGGDDFRFDLRATAETPAKAAALAESCRAMVELAKLTVKAGLGAEPNDRVVTPEALAFCRQVVDGATVRRDGNTVTVRAASTSGFDRVLTGLLDEMVGNGR